MSMAVRHARNISGNIPADAPVYSVAEAAHYLGLPKATVRSWSLGRQCPTLTGNKDFPPVIEIADETNKLLSFHNLVELHVLCSVRRTHRIQLQAVRKAIAFLTQRLGTKRPFLHQQMLTDGKQLFVEKYGKLVNVTADGQLKMKQVLDVFLKRIVRDAQGAPIRLFPFTRQFTQGCLAPRIVAIDPRICFGKPCIAGTRISTIILAERHKAGDSIALLAADYDRPEEEIEEAVRYESRVAA